MLSLYLHRSATFSYVKQRKIATDGSQSVKVGTVWQKHSFRIGISQGGLQRGRTYVSLSFPVFSYQLKFPSLFKETERQKVQLESENRALRDKVCIYYFAYRLSPTSSVQTLNFIDLFLTVTRYSK